MINLEKIFVHIFPSIDIGKTTDYYVPNNEFIQRSTEINSTKLQCIAGPNVAFISILRQEVDQHGSIIVAPADAWHAWHRERMVNQRGDPMVMEHSYGKPPIYR